MMPHLRLRVPVTEAQAELLQQRINGAGMKVAYNEEQHGATLVAAIGCTRSQERTLREILRELGVSPTSDD